MTVDLCAGRRRKRLVSGDRDSDGRQAGLRDEDTLLSLRSLEAGLPRRQLGLQGDDVAQFGRVVEVRTRSCVIESLALATREATSAT